MHTTIRHWLSAAALMLAVLMSTNVTAAPVVVGSINPATRQITIFQDILVSSFQDGTPIHHIYGNFNDISNGFLMIRAGKTSEGVCQTDVFRLLRLSGNRLALAADSLTEVPWDGTGSIRPIKLCFSGTCHGNCQILGVPETIDLNDYKCHCSTATGQCQAALPEWHPIDDIVLQGPEL
jgi:hypothetical protein